MDLKTMVGPVPIRDSLPSLPLSMFVRPGGELGRAGGDRFLWSHRRRAADLLITAKHSTGGLQVTSALIQSSPGRQAENMCHHRTPGDPTHIWAAACGNHRSMFLLLH